MSEAKVISVNPAEKSLGEFYKGSIYSELRHSNKSQETARCNHSTLFNFLFPTKNCGFNNSLLLLSIRFILGSCMIYEGVKCLLGSTGTDIFQSQFFGALLVTVGVVAIIGLFTRAIIMLPSILYILAFINSIGSNVNEMSLYAGFLSLIICIAGPGWFSIDGMINRWYHGEKRAKKAKAKKVSERLSYRAFASSIVD